MLGPTLLAAIAILASASALVGQESECQFTDQGRVQQIDEGGAQIILLHDPFVVVCADGAELRANSGRLNRLLRELYLLGDVFFQDSVRTLTADEATYYADMGRLWARGDVEFVDRQEGSTLSGPELEYYRATEERPLSQMTATQRPTLTLPPAADAPADDAAPLEMIADRVMMMGEDELTATGMVVITRADLTATSGAARYNSLTEDLELEENAVVRSEEFELLGQNVQAQLTEGALEHLYSQGDAALEGEDLRVMGDELRLFFEDEAIQRAVATVDSEVVERRAIAISETFKFSADSLDATFEDQQPRIVYGIGEARGETIDTTGAVMSGDPFAIGQAPSDTTQAPADSGVVALAPADSLSPLMDSVARPLEPSDFDPPVLSSDWIVGDTLIGYFASVEPAEAASADPSADSGGVQRDSSVVEAGDGEETEVVLERLVAIGSAQSLYRLVAENDPTGERRNVNFLVGERIELELVDGELEVAQVDGLKHGIYLEAQPPAADTTGAQPPDSIPEPPTPANGRGA